MVIEMPDQLMNFIGLLAIGIVVTIPIAVHVSYRQMKIRQARSLSDTSGTFSGTVKGV